MAKTAVPTIFCGFGSLMDIDKLIQPHAGLAPAPRFGSLMDIDKLIQGGSTMQMIIRFGSLMDIDKLIPVAAISPWCPVLVL